MDCKWTFVVVIICICLHHAIGAPPARPLFGPQEGMEFLHGVMMHGDEKTGDSHTKEDEYQRLQDIDKIRAEAKENKDGPCEGMDCLHGVLMHGDDDTGVKHMEQEQAGPVDEGKQAGPCEGMDCMHGVLMHGDDEQGNKHKLEDGRKTATMKPQLSGASDPEHLLHQGDDGAHDHEAAQPDKHDGVRSSVGDPEHLLHGDDTVHDDNAPEREPLRKESGVMNPEHFLHGSEGGDVHNEEKQRLREEAKSGSKPINPVDPDEMIHGDEPSNIGTMSKDEASDYRQWKIEKNVEQKNGFLGFSFPFVSDSILDEIDTLKRRYMAKFWGSDPENGDSSESTASSGKYDTNTDMRHELEAIGNTDQLKDHTHEEKKETTTKPLRKDL